MVRKVFTIFLFIGALSLFFAGISSADTTYNVRVLPWSSGSAASALTFNLFRLVGSASIAGVTRTGGPFTPDSLGRFSVTFPDSYTIPLTGGPVTSSVYILSRTNGNARVFLGVGRVVDQIIGP